MASVLKAGHPVSCSCVCVVCLVWVGEVGWWGRLVRWVSEVGWLVRWVGW